MIRIILLLAEYVCFCKAIEFATHPSKDPTLMGLYSNDKFLAILVLILSGIILHKIKSYSLENKNLPLFKYPIQIGFIIIIISYLFQLNTNLTIGVDFAEQLKSLLQWTDGTTAKWNTIKLLDINDLRKTNEIWLFRPFGAMIYYIPFVYINIPLGESLRLAQLILCIFVLYSWFKIGNICKLNSNNQLTLCICISLWLSTLLSFIGNVQLLVTAYSSLLTLAAIKYINETNNDRPFYNQLKLLCISFFLGAIVLIKLSGLIFNGTILLFCLSFIIIKSANLKNNKSDFKKFITCLLASIFFITPFIFLNLINNINGLNVDNVYKQDYNNNPFYQFLWGSYFSETTEFPDIILSLLSSWATFSPLNSIQTLTSNALTYLGYIDNFLYDLETNPKVMYKSITGILLSIPVLYLIKTYKSNPEINKLFIISLLTIPFVAFMLLANRHGYNYLITGTYNQQYIPFFILLFLIIVSKNKSNLNILLKLLLFFFSIVFFTFSNTQSLFLDINKVFSSNILGSENINNEFYGNEVNKVYELVNSNRNDLDIPIFFFANTSIAEISILFKGNVGGIAGANEWCRSSNPPLETFNQKMFLLFDSRLNSEQINSLLNRMKYTNIQTILNLSGSAKVYLLN